MVEKLSQRGNIKVQGYGKLHILDVGLLSSCLYIVHSRPSEFPCAIKPRSHDALELIRASSGMELFE